MTGVKRIVLDVLKPHQPTILELGKAIAALGEDYRVSITVDAVDEKTESVTAIIEGDALELEDIAETINGMGGSIHSIDEVEVSGASGAKP